MNGILLDNWTLEDIYSEEIENCEKTYNDLLEAIILWDNLYYPENSSSSWWKYISDNNGLKDIITPLFDNEKMFEIETKEIYNSVPSFKSYTKTVGMGGIRYALLSNGNGFDYFPCTKRSAFLSQKIIKEKIQQTITRHDLMETFDKEALRYYKELNDFLGGEIIKFKTPILADYILQNTPSDMSCIEYALQLRMDKHVLRYRKYLGEVEHAINNAQWHVLSEFKYVTEELVQDIIKKKPCTFSMTVGVFTLPSINIEIPFRLHKKYIHLSFLRDLGKFINNRNNI